MRSIDVIKRQTSKRKYVEIFIHHVGSVRRTEQKDSVC
jgi:hypothetical protein